MISPPFSKAHTCHTAMLQEPFRIEPTMLKYEPTKQNMAHSTQEDTPPSTPTAVSAAAHQLLSEIQSIYTVLAKCRNLAPGPEVNALLTHLVNLCIQPMGSAIVGYFFSLPGVERLCLSLRPLCAIAEGELERHWVDRILNTHKQSEAPQPTPNVVSQTRALLETFPYYTNYLDLSRLECSILEAFLPPPPASRLSDSNSDMGITNVAFIGSGPLPLTSLCMLDRYPQATVHNIDRDMDALQISAQLSQNLGLEERMTFSCEDVAIDADNECYADGEIADGKDGILTKTNWASFQVVFLAALVGMDSASKIEILGSLRGKLIPGTLVVARSAEGLRGVLYPVLELSSDLQDIGYDVLAVVHPWTKVVNSVVVLRVR